MKQFKFKKNKNRELFLYSIRVHTIKIFKNLNKICNVFLHKMYRESETNE